MRSAGHQQSVIASTPPKRARSESRYEVNAAMSTRPTTTDEAVAEVVVDDEVGDTVLADAGDTQVILKPAAFTAAHAAADARDRSERRRGLADVVSERIRKKLSDRVHDLRVRLEGNTLFLEGRCATYYTKQLAQHAALGVLEDEHLENAIVVTM